MRFFRRSLIALGLSATLPAVVFAAVAAFYLLRMERDRVEAATLARAELLTALVEARVQRDLAALEVLTNSSSLQSEDQASFRRRALGVLQSNPDWQRLRLLDIKQRATRLALPEGDSSIPLSQAQWAMAEKAASDRALQAGSVERSETPVVWHYAPVVTESEVRYVLALAVSTDVFQNLLVEYAPQTSTTAIVDRDALFIARSLNYEERVGLPATRFVGAAVARANRGFYPGETYEGLKNYSAYDTSERFGWSVHIAVPSSLIDTPTAWSFAIAGLAGLGAIVLAGFLVLLVLRDMAERRRADDALRQSQKMEAVGQLTGGIAHDFNNLLTAIIGNLDMIHTRAAGNERMQRMASNALEAARRGAKLASQLLAFSRTQRLVVRRIDLQQLINGMSGLLTQSVGPSVKVEIDIDPEARYVVSDANQLELALLNLAVNSRDAMNGAGVLKIESRPATDVDRTLPRGEYVDVCVSDTGAGMTDEVCGRAIEPFFTTKPTGAGTGLGLSQVYGVVRESGGSLSLQSEVGRGTTVKMTLRRGSPEEIPATRPTRIAIEAPADEEATSGADILVVDDDRLVRRFMVESLRSMGHQVKDAAEGTSALSLLGQHRFDLLLVDYAMPGMNGAEVARAALEKQPHIKVLVVSGYADSAALAAAIGSASQLRKPFDLAELRAAVTQILMTEPTADAMTDNA